MVVMYFNRKKVVDDFYSVKETGNIPVNRDGWVITPKGVRTNGFKDKDSYCHIHVNGKSIPIHRIVAMTFLDVPDDWEKLDVNHIDGMKSNNLVSNLEWASRKENNWHAVKYGLNSQAKVILVKNLYTKEITKFYSIQHAAREMGCAGGSIHNYLRNMRFVKPFRGHYSIIYQGEEWPIFTHKDVKPFGYPNIDQDSVILYSLDRSKPSIVFPSKRGISEYLSSEYIMEKEIKGYIPLYLVDLSKYAEDINDVLGNSVFRYDLLKFNKNPNNTKPKKVKVENKVTGDVIIFNNAREVANFLNINYQALKRSIWRTKGDFMGYYINYIV